MEDFFRNLKAGDEGTVIKLLEGDPALLEARDEMDLTPLEVAARRGLHDLMRLLIQMGADVNALGVIGRTPLHHAAIRRDNAESVALLLTHGAQKAIRDWTDRTPVMIACLRGHLGSVRLLVHHMGAKGLDDKDLDGHTALHLASERGRKEVVTFLLLSGADPTILNNEGKTPRQWAQEYDGRGGDAEGRARCIARLKRGEREFERRYVLSRATCLHKAYLMRRDMLTGQVPSYLEARVAAGHAVPNVKVVSPQAKGGRKDDQVGHAMVKFVVMGLHEDLVTELLEGLY